MNPATAIAAIAVDPTATRRMRHNASRTPNILSSPPPVVFSVLLTDTFCYSVARVNQLRLPPTTRRFFVNQPMRYTWLQTALFCIIAALGVLYFVRLGQTIVRWM
jgi:hypothetical protein